MIADPLNIEGKTWCIFGDHYPASRGGGVANWVSVLMEREGWFATGLSRFTLTFVQRGPYVPAHIASGVVVRDGSDGQSAKWEAYLAQVPMRRFARKRRELVVTLRGDPGFDFFDRRYLVNVTVPDIQTGTAMVLSALQYAQSTLKASDGVDLVPMIRSAEALLVRKWPDDQAMRAELSVAYELDRARIAAMDPWAKIDMRGFHPAARKFLDQPSDWSAVDDFSPHGNDLGADVLGGWSKLKAMNIPALAQHFEIDLAEDDAQASMARIQLSNAIAFGHIKKSGSCPSDIAVIALQALRTDRAQASQCVVHDHLAAWEASCARYMSILERLAGE